MKKALVVISTLLLFSCGSKALSYLNTAIDIMEENSIKKKEIDWKELRTSALAEMKGKESIEETYPIIEKILRELGDNHSFLLTEQLRTKMRQAHENLPIVEYKIINKQIAYLKIPAFMGSDSLPNNFAESIQKQIKKLDKKEIKSWIIDLTENTGGNMWPMYLGLSPILGDGISGYFLDSENKFYEWRYSNNAVYEGKTKHLEIEDSYVLNNTDYDKIAVLIGRKTASSGEAIAIAFKEFPKTQFFGEFTHGLTTGNSIHPLSDGAKLILTTSIFVDRTKTIYGGPIEPDIYTTKPEEKAVKWLMEK
ncbi:S41 family peptidase [Maribacter aestuarii]|uniref:S41 family peptidase n=1 Tax=Maribacter aestuarii TaxID=1130723 RepID=UPI00248CA6DB|nr:S41 family peptidase [Maribacter aestuarii]